MTVPSALVTFFYLREEAMAIPNTCRPQVSPTINIP